MKKLMLMVLVFNVSNTLPILGLFKSKKEEAYRAIDKFLNFNFGVTSDKDLYGKKLETRLRNIRKTIKNNPQFFNDDTGRYYIKALKDKLNDLITPMTELNEKRVKIIDRSTGQDKIRATIDQLESSLDYINEKYPEFNQQKSGATVKSTSEESDPFGLRYQQETDENYELNYNRSSGNNSGKKLTLNSVDPNGSWFVEDEGTTGNLSQADYGRSLAGSRLTPAELSQAEQQAKKAKELEAKELEGVQPADLHDQKGEPVVNGTTPSTEEEQAKYAQDEWDLTPKEIAGQREQIQRGYSNQRNQQDHTDPQEEGEVPNWYGW